MATQKTTGEIRALLNLACLDFESVENKALNEYLPKIFHSCPFTDEPCTIKQCVDCGVFLNHSNKLKSLSKTKKSK
jgi:hypothetical protein